MTLKCPYEVKMTFYGQMDGFIGFRRSKYIGNEVPIFNKGIFHFFTFKLNSKTDANETIRFSS